MAKHPYNVKIERRPTHLLNMRPVPTLALPSQVDLRNRLPNPYDQGSLGSCTANALVAAFQYIVPSFMGSRLFLYYNERYIEHTIPYDAGATLADGITAMKKFGICSESLWPYTTNTFAKRPPQVCYAAAQNDRVLNAHNLIQTENNMKASLHNRLPFVVGISVFDAFESATVAKTGIVPLPGAMDVSLGGHAVLVCGYDDTFSGGVWIVRNSWGVNWGDRGYFYLPYAYLTDPNLSSDIWTITATNVLPVSKKKLPCVSRPYNVFAGPPFKCRG